MGRGLSIETANLGQRYSMGNAPARGVEMPDTGLTPSLCSRRVPSGPVFGSPIVTLEGHYLGYQGIGNEGVVGNNSGETGPQNRKPGFQERMRQRRENRDLRQRLDTLHEMQREMDAASTLPSVDSYSFMLSGLTLGGRFGHRHETLLNGKFGIETENMHYKSGSRVHGFVQPSEQYTTYTTPDGRIFGINPNMQQVVWEKRPIGNTVYSRTIHPPEGTEAIRLTQATELGEQTVGLGIIHPRGNSEIKKYVAQMQGRMRRHERVSGALRNAEPIIKGVEGALAFALPTTALGVMGFEIGKLVGAGIGTLIIPIPGVGTVSGAIVGGVIGAFVFGAAGAVAGFFLGREIVGTGTGKNTKKFADTLAQQFADKKNRLPKTSFPRSN